LTTWGSALLAATEKKGRLLPTVTEVNVAATMRDGIVLRADVYHPPQDGRYPVLLCRTPYDKTREGYVEAGQRMAERGYTVVVQDVRGRHASEGEFRPGLYSAEHDDAEDGYDAVEWAAQLPSSTGAVGTFGGSYDGWTQWELAHARPPHLKAMIPSAIAANLLDRELGGVLRLGRVLEWTINGLSLDAGRRRGVPFLPVSGEEARRLWVERDRHKWLWHLPLREIPDQIMPGMGKHWRRWLDDHATDHFRFLEKHREIDVPALTITGWYDQQIGTIKHFTGMVKNSRSARARQSQRLIIGPWTHTLTGLGRKVGQVDFGALAQRDYYEIADRWFTRWLKDTPNDDEERPPIEVFVMGSNRWRHEREWPLAGTRYTDFFLRSGGGANTASGDGGLSREAPGEEPADEYRYDPRDPVMTLYSAQGQQEPHDQRPLDGRRDVLVYATPVLEEALEVIGPVVVELWAVSSARDTDFTAKLIDVWPNGFVQELCHGIVRARYRESYEAPTLIEPGKAYRYRIQVNPTGNLFLPGHRIRLDISSSDFPNFDRNHNTGGADYAEAVLNSAHQQILHDSVHPSRLILPVIG
jgi:putative CocE/NonD family hydrolase